MPFLKYDQTALKHLLLAAMIAGLFTGSVARAQDAAPKPPAFEVVSITKVVLPPGQMVFHFRGDKATRTLKATGNRLTLRRFTLTDLILEAYDLDDYQLSGVPAWGKPGQDLYDVIAKSEGEASPPSNQLRLMLQTMLAERFQLKVHRETRELPLYNLVIGKNGLKIKEAVPDPPVEVGAGGGRGAAAAPRPRESSSFDSVNASDERVIKGSIGGLVRLIGLYLDHPLIDKTGLTGTYEYTWGQQELMEEVRELGKPAPGIFPKVEKFGLKVEKQTGPVEVVVVDKAEKASEN